MKKGYILGVMMLIGLSSFAQEDEPADTTRINLGEKEILIIDHSEDSLIIEDGDTVRYEFSKPKPEAHWAGVDFGVTMLFNSAGGNSFPNDPQWNNDPARSQVWNLNLFEHKFNIAKEYFGITTGLGFSFTSVALKNNYILVDTPDSLYAFMDTVNNYSKNKLKAAYLTIPLLLEFNTNIDSDKSFYLAAGVVGGIRLTSKTKRKGEVDGEKFTIKNKGTYSLNPFKLDATVRLGYSDFGVFASYSLLPLFDVGKTAEAYPLTFGLSVNF
ncbi:MAG: outer membrane beta-barrel protein [Fluviicola sp.]|nr:outer membrane beta-barrel protein [Fluviicola sp.]